MKIDLLIQCGSQATQDAIHDALTYILASPDKTHVAARVGLVRDGAHGEVLCVNFNAKLRVMELGLESLATVEPRLTVGSDAVMIKGLLTLLREARHA